MSITNPFSMLWTASRSQLAVYIPAAIVSIWVAGKVLRAVIHYAFPSAVPGETNTALLASPRLNSSQNATAKDLESVTEYDYIIIGTGTAGCVIANRLTENSNVSVLAIESGHSDLKQLFSRIPAGFAQLFRTPADHDITTTPQKHAGNRAMQWPRGKMLGGCSAINAMIFNKGAPDDYDEWERLGNEGWSYKDLVPYMKKAECFHGDTKEKLSPEDLEQHGRKGPWQVGYSYACKILPDFLDACAVQGLTKVQDINTNKGINGATRLQTFIDSKGQRSSAAVAYLTKGVMTRSNLKVLVGQTVTRIIFDESGSQPRAIGVEMASDSQATIRYVAKARKEVILCAGAVHTPQILKVSGIGPTSELKRHEIKVVKDIPAVGENLADHLYVNFISRVARGMSIQVLADPLRSLPHLIEWLRHGTGMMTSNVADGAAFLRTVDREDVPASLRQNDLSSGKTSSDLEILFGAAVYQNHGATKATDKDDYASVGAIHLRPSSRGNITIASSSVFTPPVVEANYLKDQHDIDTLVYGMKLTRKIFHSMKNFRGWYFPANVDNMTDQDMVQHVRDTCETIYHPMCSAKMGPDAQSSVVDAKLRVHGVQGLRIADASIFPMPVACHPCAPVIMVGEKAADLMKEGW